MSAEERGRGGKKMLLTRKWTVVLLALGVLSAVRHIALSQEMKPGVTASFASDEPVVTHHQVTIHGQTLGYSARVGYLSIRDEEQVVRARMFYVAYVLDRPENAPQRPLLFAWNGGPGSNASLLELDAMGPLRLNKQPGPSNPRKPATLVANEDTWLQFADLVFVDPINTGYSYATTPEFLKEFLNDQGDADSIAEFIRLYRVHFALQTAPLYIMGESYGTFRAAGVADILGKRRILLDGVVMLSTVLNFEESHSPDLSPVFLLPNYAATAFVQHRLNPELEVSLTKTVDQAQHWAETEYLADLFAGDRLSAERKKAAAQKLAQYTGIPSETWEQANLRLGPDQFAADVLGPAKKEYVGHYDTTIVGKLGHPGEPYNVSADPSLDNGVDAMVYGYLRDELGWKTDAFYAGPFGGGYPSPPSFRADWMSVRWNRGYGYADRGAALADALEQNPGLRVFIAHGYFDLSTPFAATEYVVSHLDLSPDARKRITFVRYEGGHAAYIAPAVRKQFSEDVSAFVAAGASSR
jgi:carboxypeptidase C (cathepsin A)